jgi:hypothetical protein
VTARRTSLLRRATTLLLALGAGASASNAERPFVFVEAIQASTELPEESLLDVGIEILDPGFGDDSQADLESKGVFTDLRLSESRYIPFHLASTLQATGNWGAVRVVPSGSTHIDVRVFGQILESTGRELRLKLAAADSTGRTWLNKKYRFVTDDHAYEPDLLAKEDPYQSLYNTIANDLLESRRKVDDDDLESIRTTTGLRFARDLSPDPFADYIKGNKKGRWKIQRLPSVEDPMMQRVAAIRERDHMLVDALNEHYANFYLRMQGSYAEWRSYSYEEQVALKKLRSQARWSKILGAVAIIGTAASSGGGSAGRAARAAGATAGVLAIQHGLSLSAEVKMHAEAIRELAASFDLEVAPMLVEVEGQTMKLTGSAEAQYDEWRALLRRIFNNETGLEIDPNETPPQAPSQTAATTGD